MLDFGILTFFFKYFFFRISEFSKANLIFRISELLEYQNFQFRWVYLEYWDLRYYFLKMLIILVFPIGYKLSPLYTIELHLQL